MRALRKDPEPVPRRPCSRIFTLKRIGHRHATSTRSLISRPIQASPCQLLSQSRNQTLRQHHRPIFSAFAFADDDGAVLKIHILHPKLQALIDPHPRSIQQLSEQAMLPVKET